MSDENKIKKQTQFIIYGIFKDLASIKKAVESFNNHKFRNSDLSVLMHGTNEEANSYISWLAGAEGLAIPDLGPFIAAGPIKATIAGASIGEALMGIGIPGYETRRYEDLIKKGGMLISAFADNNDWALKAKLIFEDCDASEVSSSDSSTDTTIGPRTYKDRFENESIGPI